MRALPAIGVALGTLVAVGGLVGVVAPSVLLRFAQSLQSVEALYAVAAIRIALGAFLLWVARESRMPKTLRVVGLIVIGAGLLTPFIGVERLQAVLSWWSAQGPWFMRASSAAAVILGLFIVYVLVPPRRPGA